MNFSFSHEKAIASSVDPGGGKGRGDQQSLLKELTVNFHCHMKLNDCLCSHHIQ